MDYHVMQQRRIPERPLRAIEFLRQHDSESDEELFRIDRDVAPYLQQMIAEFHRLMQFDVSSALKFASQFLMLFPQQRDALGLTDEFFHTVKKCIDEAERPTLNMHQLSLLGYAIQIFPERRAELFAIPHDAEQCFNWIQQRVGHCGIENTINEVYSYLVLYPDQKNRFPFSEIEREAAAAILRLHRISKFLACFPNGKRALKQFDTVLQDARKNLEECRTKGLWDQFTECASAIAIVTADDIRIDERGVHLIHNKKMAQPIPPLPPRSTV